MKICEATIRNVMGIEELSIQPGHLTLIQGRNGAGKTSVLAALRDLFSGGHDPELIRKGADQGEVEIVLEDGVTISKVIRPEKSTLTVRHPQLGKVSKPQQYVNALVNTLSVDPVQFLTQKPKDRLATLLEAMPLRITADQIGFLPARVAEALDLDAHALEVLGQAHKALYDERTGVNKAAKEKRATATEMARTLPAESKDGMDWHLTCTKARFDLTRLNEATQAAVDAIKGNAAAEHTRIEAELQSKMEELRKIAAHEKRCADAARNLALEDLQCDYIPKRDTLTDQITEAQTMIQEAARAGEARKLVTRLQADAAELEKQSENLSKALDKLQDLKGSILEKTPIRGVTIQEGEILVDGVPFDKVNEARRIQIALEVARIRAGDLPLVLVDDAEHFDSINMDRFRKAAAKAGLQIVAAKVADSDLTVAAEGVPNVA
jgi:DNA repair exonuclease SbcCD ATPase subunit